MIPDMLPIHFGLIMAVFRQHGFDIELLTSSERSVTDEGLKHVHNDTCYPALLVIGQFLEAIKSGRYDTDKIAVMISQTGGGCRASNYLFLLKKALAKDYPQIPVLSINFSGLQKNQGFEVTLPMFWMFLHAALYGDILMNCYNRARTYEKTSGDAKRMLSRWEKRLAHSFTDGSYKRTRHFYRRILDDFANIPMHRFDKPKVGIVGEIYVKYSPLANNHLEDFLIREGAEPIVPSFLDFCLYCAVNTVNDSKIYGIFTPKTLAFNAAYKFLLAKSYEMSELIASQGVFEVPHNFEELRAFADSLIHQGVKMGEGWLIPAEMSALCAHGVPNIVVAQPFGCLPNHIVGRGMNRVVRDNFPEANIVAVDYDPGATRVNQENRIKLMLSNVKN
ncbi:MAG: 2-hydroxyacyl-CoA dehydratase [Ruminococcus sp.]|nr:2-hydroxyacyl-CoA dehydratase [Ruminococcus sp.]